MPGTLREIQKPGLPHCSRRFVFYTTQQERKQAGIREVNPSAPQVASNCQGPCDIHHRLTAIPATNNGRIGGALRLVVEPDSRRALNAYFAARLNSREAAKYCSPRRKPWVARGQKVSPGGARENVAYIRQYSASSNFQHPPTPTSDQA